jgi:hypothetical protein
MLCARRLRTLGAAVALAAACVTLAGSSVPSAPFFPFVLPWNESSPGLLDLSSWNGRPIGAFDVTRRLTVSPDGHYAVAGKRVRLLGVNFSSLPAPEESRVIARRMAKFGINFVRLHALDAPWLARNLFARGWGERSIEPDPAMLARLDSLVAAFAEAGIYVELTLLTGRDFSSADGLPPELDTIGDWKARQSLGFFYEPIYRLQEQWARALLDRTSTVRRVRYADDPAVAMVEINNENGLVHSWLGGALDGLPDVFIQDLRRTWNAFLRSRYGTQERFVKALALAAAPGPVLVDPRGPFRWEAEFHDTARGTLSSGADPKEGTLARVDITATGTQSWHVQLARPGFAVKAGTLYTLSFAARSDKPRRAAIALVMAHDPWDDLGFWRDIELSPGWQRFEYVVTPSPSDAEARLLVSDLGLETGRVEIAGASFREGGRALAASEDLDAGTVAVPRSDAVTSTAYRSAWLSWLYDRDLDYWKRMYRFLKEDLGVRAVVVGTSVMTATPVQMAALDGIDTHVYWRHPEFPGTAWNMSDWFLRNDPMVKDPAAGAVGQAATSRVAGKPFVVSEFCEPAPNSFAAEQLPLAAAYAAYQDWDGLLLFAYSPAGPGPDDWSSGRMADFFDVANNPLLWPYLVSAAALFRRGDVAVARTWRYGVLSDQRERDALQTASAWNLRLEGASGMSPGDVRTSGTAIRIGPGAPEARPTGLPASGPARSDTGQLSWSSSDGIFTLDTPLSKAVVGFVQGRSVALDSFTLTLEKSSLGFASAALSALVGTPGAQGSRCLLTIAAAAHNTGMGLFRYGTTAAVDVPPEGSLVSCRPDFGTGPVMAEGVTATIDVRESPGVRRVTVKALDVTGKAVRDVPVTRKAGVATFPVRPEYATLWFEIDFD